MNYKEMSSTNASSSKGFFGRSLLRREIALMLLIKLMLIFTIKYLFFSDPLPKDQLEERLEILFSTQSDSLPTNPIHVNEGKTP